MTANEVREKYINFFVNPPRNHKQISPAPLVLEDDPTTLFTSSGMQPLVPYLMGEPHPTGSNRLVDSQPSIRTIDIDEVGDNRHLTFFEMLGNWSLGDYFKEDQLPWIWEFFTEELHLAKDKLWVSVFEGNNQVPKDAESINIWKKLGVPVKRICEYGVEKNWWSRTGTPAQMPVGEIGGPDSEVFYDFGEELKLHEKSEFKNEKCHPNCDCGRYLEIGNSVFIQYKKIGKNELEELPNKNVDFGGGLERIVAAVNGDPDTFKTDLFLDLIKEIEEVSRSDYQENTKEFRIIADHIKASVMLIVNGVIPSNKQQGYVLRRLLRRAAIKMRVIGGGLTPIPGFKSIANEVLRVYDGVYVNMGSDMKRVDEVIEDEMLKFSVTLDRGLKIIEGYKNEQFNGLNAFGLFQSYGFPVELTKELFIKKGMKADDKKFDQDFEEAYKTHQNLSRTVSAGVFKGGLADHSPEVIRFHTATHLLLSSLRKVLGDQIVQKGQNITKERTRFDFPNPEKLTEDQLKKVEKMINDVISKDLPVDFKIMPKDEALKTGAIHAFNEKYADTVKVYFVGDSLEKAVSKEFCGGPHVASTGEIGRVRIIKQEKTGSNLIRIYLTAENG